MEQSKRCPKCGQIKPIDAFGLDRNSKSGCKLHCRECRAIEAKIRRQNNPDYDRNRYLSQQERFKEMAKARYWKNPETARAKVRKRRADNPDKLKAMDHLYYENNRTSKIAGVYVYNAKYPEKAVQRHNARKARANNNGVYKLFEKELRQMRQKPCFHCGSTHRIQLDHVIPLARGGSHSIGNLMPLCQKCNCTKGSKTYMEFRVMLMRRNAILAT